MALTLQGHILFEVNRSVISWELVHLVPSAVMFWGWI